MEADHKLLNKSLPDGFHMTKFRELSSSWCDGHILPTSCSGLAIVSAYPILETSFHMYTWRGTVWDAEAFAGKPLIKRHRLKHRNHLGQDAIALLHPLVVGCQARIRAQLRQTELAAERLPQPITDDTDEHLLVAGALEYIVDGPRRAAHGHGRWRLAQNRLLRHVLPHHVSRGFKQ